MSYFPANYLPAQENYTPGRLVSVQASPLGSNRYLAGSQVPTTPINRPRLDSGSSLTVIDGRKVLDLSRFSTPVHSDRTFANPLEPIRQPLGRQTPINVYHQEYFGKTAPQPSLSVRDPRLNGNLPASAGQTLPPKVGSVRTEFVPSLALDTGVRPVPGSQRDHSPFSHSGSNQTVASSIQLSSHPRNLPLPDASGEIRVISRSRERTENLQSFRGLQTNDQSFQSRTQNPFFAPIDVYQRLADPQIISGQPPNQFRYDVSKSQTAFPLERTSQKASNGVIRTSQQRPPSDTSAMTDRKYSDSQIDLGSKKIVFEKSAAFKTQTETEFTGSRAPVAGLSERRDSSNRENSYHSARESPFLQISESQNSLKAINGVASQAASGAGEGRPSMPWENKVAKPATNSSLTVEWHNAFKPSKERQVVQTPPTLMLDLGTTGGAVSPASPTDSQPRYVNQQTVVPPAQAKYFLPSPRSSHKQLHTSEIVIGSLQQSSIPDLSLNGQRRSANFLMNKSLNVLPYAHPADKTPAKRPPGVESPQKQPDTDTGSIYKGLKFRKSIKVRSDDPFASLTFRSSDVHNAYHTNPNLSCTTITTSLPPPELKRNSSDNNLNKVTSQPQQKAEVPGVDYLCSPIGRDSQYNFSRKSILKRTPVGARKSSYAGKNVKINEDMNRHHEFERVNFREPRRRRQGSYFDKLEREEQERLAADQTPQ